LHENLLKFANNNLVLMVVEMTIALVLIRASHLMVLGH